MWTDFFCGKIRRVFVGGSAVFFTLFCCIYAFFLSQAKVVAFSVSFYYLVSENTHIEAGAEFIKLEGGAGYLLCYEQKEYAVLSVYLHKADGVAVQTSLSKIGKNTRILCVKRQKLYFKTQKEKQNAGIYIGALQTLYGCAQVLNECIERLENGITQEGCKRILTPLESQFSYLSKEYEESYPSFAKMCKQTAEDLFLKGQDIVFIKDLRYLLCEICVALENMASEFSI